MTRTEMDDTQQPHHAQDFTRTARAERRNGRQSENGREHKIEVERWREVGRNLAGQIDEQVHKRPYVVLGAAAGFGFVAGSLLGSRLGQLLLAAGIGYAAKQAFGEDLGLDRIQAGIERLTAEAERSSSKV